MSSRNMPSPMAILLLEVTVAMASTSMYVCMSIFVCVYDAKVAYSVQSSPPQLRTKGKHYAN